MFGNGSISLKTVAFLKCLITKSKKMKKAIIFICSSTFALFLFLNGNSTNNSGDISLDNLISMNTADATCEYHWSSHMHCNSYGRCANTGDGISCTP